MNLDDPRLVFQRSDVDLGRNGPFWIQTFSGRQMFLWEPSPNDFSIQDIAVSLARTARFTGHTKNCASMSGYSVAQHSWACSIIEPSIAALFHDGAEFATGDISRPLKALLNALAPGVLKEIERRISEAVRLKLGLRSGCFDAPSIKRADNIMLATEKRDLMASEPAPWISLPEPTKERIVVFGSPAQAYSVFMRRFRELGGSEE